MTDKSSAADRRLDMMIRLALLNIAEEKWKQIEELDVSDVTLSERHVKRMRKLLTKGAPAVRRKKIVKRVLLVALVALSTLAMLGLAIQPVRKAFSNAIVTWYKDFFRVEMQEIVSEQLQTIEDYKEPALLNGWEKTIQQESQFSQSIIYENDKGNTVHYVQRVLGESVTINIDNSRHVEDIKINNNLALLYLDENGENCIIQWDDNKYIYLLDGNLSIDLLVQIAESVK